MIGPSLVFDIFVLLAASGSGGRGGGNNNNNSGGRGGGDRSRSRTNNNDNNPSQQRSPRNPNDNSFEGQSGGYNSNNNNNNGNNSNRGRQRYAPTRDSRGGTRNKPQGGGRGGQGRNNNNEERQEDILPPAPPLTKPNGPYPTYFTCRHTFEETLVEEIKHYNPTSKVAAIYPGLVRAEGLVQSNDNDDDNTNYHHFWDPVYALQSLPDCRIIASENSIKGLARAIAEAEGFSKLLMGAPRGSLSIHALVPGMCKGQKDPKLQRRAYLVAEAVQDIWKGQFPAARKPKQAVDDESNKNDKVQNMDDKKKSYPLLLQVLLLSPDVAAVSLAPCQPTKESSLPQLWPNPHYPAGMARVDIRDYQMPSSAYRKLLEAFGCWGSMPTPTTTSEDITFVDLGASPGGWTAALLLFCEGFLNAANDGAAATNNINDGPRVHVYAIDRSPLDRSLMNDRRVTFLKGDAFTFEPEQPVTWMVSDIIAYPDRIIELIDLWCRKELAANMIITMKFQGSEPSWDDLEKAIQVAESYQYQARAKHFFNNKNEVTLMLRRETTGASDHDPAVSSIASFYKRVRTFTKAS